MNPTSLLSIATTATSLTDATAATATAADTGETTLELIRLFVLLVGAISLDDADLSGKFGDSRSFKDSAKRELHA